MVNYSCISFSWSVHKDPLRKEPMRVSSDDGGREWRRLARICTHCFVSGDIERSAKMPHFNGSLGSRWTVVVDRH